MGGGRDSRTSSDSDSSSSRTKKSSSRSGHRSRRKKRSRSRSSSTINKRSSSAESVSRHQRKSAKKSSHRRDKSRRSSTSRTPPTASHRSVRKSRSASAERRNKKSDDSSSRSSRNRRSRSRSTTTTSRSGRSQYSSTARRSTRSPSIEEIKIKAEKVDDVKRGSPWIVMKSEEKSNEATQIKEGNVKTEVKMSVSEQMNRAQEIEEINASGFQPKDFKSGRSIATAVNTQNRQIDDHDTVIFGTSADAKAIAETSTAAIGPLNCPIVLDKGQIAHENLYGDQAAKQERWIRRLHNMRQKKLNGEAMV